MGIKQLPPGGLQVFKSSGSFTVPDYVTDVEVLVVAGGGGGGMDMGGGGGGGGVIHLTSYQVIPGSVIPVVVGQGGRGAPAAATFGNHTVHQFRIPATNGELSAFGDLVAVGGGFGGSSVWGYSPGYKGGDGGCGGGNSGYNSTAGSAAGLGTSGQGYAGGTAGGPHYSGGGGGAGGQGVGGGAVLAHGGPGKLCSILGYPAHWGGGGGGAGYSGGGGNGGIGGGGGGAVLTTTGGKGLLDGRPGGGGATGAWANCPGGDAGMYTGGGGGGGSHYNLNNKGGDGGSGIVVVRWSRSRDRNPAAKGVITDWDRYGVTYGAIYPGLYQFTPTSAGWASGAYPSGTFSSGTNFLLEFKLSIAAGLDLMVGITDSPSGWGYSDIDFAFYFNGSGISFYDSGVNQCTSVTTLLPSAADNTFSIRVEGFFAYFSVNGNIVRQVSLGAVALRAKISFGNTASSVSIYSYKSYVAEDPVLSPSLDLTGLLRAVSVPPPYPPEGLAHYWPLNSNFDDYGPAGFPAWAYGTQTFEPGFARGAALRYFGTADHFIRIAIPELMVDWTVGLWLKKLSHTITNYPIFWSGSLPYLACSGESWPFRLSYVNRFGAQSQLEGTTVPVIGQWYHVLVTKKGPAFNLYVGGMLEGTETDGSLVSNPVDVFDLGRHYDGNQYSVDGMFADLVIYSRAVSAAEALTIANQAKDFFFGPLSEKESFTVTPKSVSCRRIIEA